MGLNLNYELSNIGNISHANIKIKPLTIIAGENSSGKTFLTKSLYTIFNSIYKDHFSDDLVKKFSRLDNKYKEFIEELGKAASIDIKFQDIYGDYSNKIVSVIADLSSCRFSEQEKIVDENEELFTNFYNEIKKYYINRKSLKKFKKFSSEIDDILDTSEQFYSSINNRSQIIIDSINSSLDTGFKKNYQITNLKSLIKRDQKNDLQISIDEIGNIEIDDNSHINFEFNTLGIQKIQNIKNIVFFDSPVYIKIRKALEKNSYSLFSFLDTKEDKYLKGYPEYLEKLYSFVDKEYIDIADFDDISKDIQSMISGKLSTTKSGDIQYTDKNGSTIPLSLTAMGISNIGLIDLLLRNNVINKGSFLIMDEPEVHLHPKWQVELAKILYRIAKGGANIIIATHSLDLLKAFQVILKSEKSDAENIIGINKMPYDKEFFNLSESEKIDIVLDDLSKPYFDLYMS